MKRSTLIAKEVAVKTKGILKRTLLLLVGLAVLGGAMFAPTVQAGLKPIDEPSSYEGHPAVAFDPGWVSAFDTRLPQYFIVYESTRDGNREIYGKILNKDGDTIVWPFNISSDATVDDFNPTIAFKYGSASAPLQNYLVAWQRSDGWLVYRLFNRDGTAITPVKFITRYGKDPDASASPRGGDCRSTYGCDPYLIAYRIAARLTANVSAIGLARVNPSDGSLLSNVNVEYLNPFVDDSLYAPHIAYGHSGSPTSDYHILTYRRPAGQIVARKVTTSGFVYDPFEVSTSSTGAPVVAYSYGGNRWAIAWRDYVYNQRTATDYVRLRCQLYDSNDISLSLVPYGLGVTVAAVGGTRDPAVLPDYAVAGSQTKTSSDLGTGRALFQIPYIRGAATVPRSYKALSQVVFADNALGSLATLSDLRSNDNTAIKFAHVKIDIPSAPVPVNCDGSQSYRSSHRCALWVWEFHHSPTDHDIYGYVTSSEY